jgi:hypothetical protein
MFGNADHTSTTTVSVTRFASISAVIPTDYLAVIGFEVTYFE